MNVFVPLYIMGIFTNSPEDSAEIRGVPDDMLPILGNQQLIMLALARHMQSDGDDDDVLIQELYRRGREGIEATPPEQTKSSP